MTLIDASCVVVFPDDKAVVEVGLKRMETALRYRFGPKPEILVATASEGGELPSSISLIDPLTAARASADTWVVALSFIPSFPSSGSDAVMAPGDAGSRAGKRLFVLEPQGMLHAASSDATGRIDVRMTPETEPHLQHHVFSRLTPSRFRGQAYLFPYNGFFGGMCSAFAPIDSFGFRNATQTDAFNKRDPDHLLVAVFGGSSAWSPCCLQNETFSAVLERLLNERMAAEPGRYRRASVLNFGLNGAAVLNQLIIYLLFCHRSRPEIVVAHDIFNDLANGIQTDRELLNRYDITYLDQMEQWAQMLMGAPPGLLTQPTGADERIRMVNGPLNVVRAYLVRKRQFMNIVTAQGASFVYGIQPAWFSKALSPREQARLDPIRRQEGRNAPIYQAMERLYGIAAEALDKDSPAHYVNLDRAFRSFGPEDDFFFDHAHLFAEGDAKIAGYYAMEILDRVLPTRERTETVGRNV